MSSAVTSRGQVANSRCCFIVPGTRSATSLSENPTSPIPLGIPMSRINATRTEGNYSAGSFCLSWSGANNAAARRWRSGELPKLNRNASGAVSETACPCGTIASSGG